MRKLENSFIDLNGDQWHSYQGIFVGFDAFTPKIDSARHYFKDISTYDARLAESGDTAYSTRLIDKRDRPFGSFIYIGRQKYRIHQNGAIRYNSSIALGFIGKRGPERLQAIFHRDVTPATETPYGWDTQIADGGRLGIQLNAEASFLLLSKDQTIFNRSNYTGPFNLYSILGYDFGHRLTAAKVGFGLSNRSFLEQNGFNVIQRSGTRRNWYVGAELYSNIVGIQWYASRLWDL